MARNSSRSTKSLPPLEPAKSTRDLDIDALLTPEEQEAIREKALIKIRARDKLDAEEKLLKQEMERLDKALHPEAFVEMKEIVIDTAMFANKITLDGRQFLAGERYTVPKPVYDVLKELECNTYRHEDQIRSGNSNDAYYRKERNVRLNAQSSAATSAQARF